MTEQHRSVFSDYLLPEEEEEEYIPRPAPPPPVKRETGRPRRKKPPVGIFAAVILLLAAIAGIYAYGLPAAGALQPGAGNPFLNGCERLLCSIAGIRQTVYIEAGSGTVTLSGSDFLKEGSGASVELLSEQSTVSADTVGITPALLGFHGMRIHAAVEVGDSLPPHALPKSSAEYWIGDQMNPLDFVTDITDATEVTAELTGIPETLAEGETVFTVRLTDGGGNVSDIPCPVTVRTDSQPPVISGAADRTVTIGQAVAYKEGVTVSDDHDMNVSLKVDISDVKPDSEGSYSVVFTATDAAGNSSAQTVTFTFKKSDEALVREELEQKVAEVIGEIIQPDMTQREKARAIFDWVCSHIAYNAFADKSSLEKGALYGFRQRHGTCYTFFAVSKVLLDAAGIENIDVQNTGPGTMHYWNLINCGDGWYHFDTTPRTDTNGFFMWTDAQLMKYSREHMNSHRYDPALYPPTPDE